MKQSFTFYVRGIDMGTRSSVGANTESLRCFAVRGRRLHLVLVPPKNPPLRGLPNEAKPSESLPFRQPRRVGEDIGGGFLELTGLKPELIEGLNIGDRVRVELTRVADDEGNDEGTS